MEELIEEITLDSIELAAGEKASMSLQLPAEFIIVFEPVTHAAHFIDVKGEPTRERQSLAMIFNKTHAPTGTTEMRPGPLRLRSRTAATSGRCRRSGSPATSCTTCSASASRSSPPSGC